MVGGYWLAVVKDFVVACFSPVGLITILLISGMLVTFLSSKKRIGRVLVYAGAGLYLLLSMTPIAEVMYSRLEHAHPPMLEADTRASMVVVLSGYGEGLSFLPVTSQLNVEAVARMAEGLRIYREIPDARILMSGGQVRFGDVPISMIMAEFARTMGVPADDILVEDRSSTTYENLFEVKKLIGSEPFILVTSSVSMRRAMGVAEKLGMSAIPAPAAIWASRYYTADLSAWESIRKFVGDIGHPKNRRIEYLQRVYHEHLGYLWYRARGWI